MTRLVNLRVLMVLGIFWGSPHPGTAKDNLPNKPASAAPSSQLQSNAPIEEIIEALKSEDDQRLMRAIDFVSARAAEAKGKGAVLPLIRALSNDRTRYSALHALKNLGPESSPAIPALYKTLTAYPNDPACRWIAADALASIGQEAVPTLQTGTQSDNPYERFWCHASLAKIEGPKSTHYPVLAKAMLSSDKTNAEQAILGLTMIGPGAVSTLPQVIAAMDNPAASKMDLACLLIRFGKEAAPSIPQLVVLLDHPHGMTGQRAAYALAEIGGPELKPAIPGLIRLLSGPQGYIRETAARALGNCGPTAASAVQPLIRCLLKDTEDHPRAESATALGKIAPADPAVHTALIQAMQDKSGRVRSHVAPVLAKHAPLTPEVKQVFRKASADHWGAVQGAYNKFIMRLDPEERKTFPRSGDGGDF